jgi:tRNA threonylcarbamoyladenosine biosynthesis protein TsaB
VIVLSLDTCLGACSAAIVDGRRLLAACSEPMLRGHQERLAPMVRDVALAAEVAFASIDRIAVTVGPGSFTGLRIGLAFAKGLSVGLDRPCVGIGVLEALAVTAGASGRIVAVIDAGRGNLLLQSFGPDDLGEGPQILPIACAVERLAGGGDPAKLAVVGPGASLLAPLFKAGAWIDLAAPAPEVVARLALQAPLLPATPLYLRPPDAVARQ